MNHYTKSSVRTPIELSKNTLVYVLYISLACLLTSGLNIVHTKYVLGIEPYFTLFIVPLIAGFIFGYISAKIKLNEHNESQAHEFIVYLKYILFCSFITAVLNVVHTDWILNQKLTTELFIAPSIAGVFFGYLLARIKILNGQLMILANTDALTHIHNRMKFENSLDCEIRNAEHHHTADFSLIYFDIDNFKSINDNFGHHTGDQTLIQFTHLVQQQLTTHELFARYGGEEFIILARHCCQNRARRIALQLQETIARYTFPVIGHLTCSFGVAQFEAHHCYASDVLKEVDAALYKAKAQGKNRVVEASLPV